jgi:hypothetical protein
MKSWIVSLALTLILGVNIAHAHGAPEVTVKPTTVAAGETIEVKGENLNPNGEISVTLEGTKFKVTLGTVKGDDEGAFVAQFAVPSNAPSGLYLVKASGTGPEGKSASAELSVTASKAPSQTREPEPMPSAAEHALPRQKSPGELGAIAALVVVSAGVGLLLVRMRK